MKKQSYSTPSLESGKKFTMEFKDKISIFVSILALVVSLGVFVDSKINTHQVEVAKQTKDSFIAYRLGDKFGVYTVAYLHTYVGSKEEIEKFRNDLLKSIQDPQGYADSLDLRMNLSELLENYDKLSAFNNSVYSVIYDKILTLHGKKVAASYDAAFWSSWILFNSQISIDKGNGEWFVDEYNNVVYSKISNMFDTLGFPKGITYNVKNVEELKELSVNLRAALKNRYID